MVFSSLPFLFVFLPLTLGLYYVAPQKARNTILLIMSLVFYSWGEPVYITIMFLSTLVDYVHGLLVERFRGRALARLFVVSSVCFNLAILGFFKYYDFVAESLAAFGLPFLMPLGLPLPIGISFYTFQTMSYTIDVYRGDSPVQRNILDFGTYVTLFPQLIAGPIVKYKEVAADLNGRREQMDDFSAGATRFTVGLCKKVLLANNIGLLWDQSVAALDQLSVAGGWLGILAFAFQIYFDFSGYSDMAIGLGRMFGFHFPENFQYPYLSQSVTEFWRRWHISLGSWFRDYLYIPLGGNRVGVGRWLFNILLVWGLTGLWHGASWNFLLWGLYYGALLILEKLFFQKILDRLPAPVRVGYTFLLVLIGWVLFAVTDLSDCARYLSVLSGFSGAPFASAVDGYFFRHFLPVLIVLLPAATPWPARAMDRLPERLKPVLAGLLVALGLTLSTAFLVDSTYNPFLYFRF